MAKKTVKVKIDGMPNGEMTVAGGSVATNASPKMQLGNRGADVEVEAKNVSGKVVVAGGHVIDFVKEVSALLDELEKIIHENLTPLYEKDSNGEMKKIEYLPGTPKEIEELVNKCLSTDPQKRPSIDQVCDSLLIIHMENKYIKINNFQNWISLIALKVKKMNKNKKIYFEY